MKKRKIYMVSPWTILLTGIFLAAVLCVDFAWLKRMFDNLDFPQIVWFCALQCIFIAPLNRLLQALKNRILCDDDAVYIFLKENNRYLRVPKDRIARLTVTAQRGMELKPEELEELEEFKNVHLTFQLTDGRNVETATNYMNGKNILSLYEELWS
ncbi:MAG: hypothetical protein LUE29_12705 [Lachnospiraceae bacterium]|nr:hypothetical protein [Lachnospiraceae bacterium]